jgi:hypothetical protein
VKFVIEITRGSDHETTVAHRSTIDAISPKGAMSAAISLLKTWKHKGADGARITNRAGQEIYRWKE